MEKILVVAEKPSVAGDIARALGRMQRHKDYYEDEKHVVTSAVGHLLEMVPPPDAEVKRGKWSLDNLPVLPARFDLQPIKASEERLRVLKRLYQRKDVGGVVNACDAGREGELIFFNLMRWLADGGRAAKPVRRLWLQSMTAAAIRQGFSRLRGNEELFPLQNAAVSRAEADWLIGINSTRAMTALHSIGGGFSLTTVGRVQTPTLAIIVERERQIKAFVSRPYWEVRADFAAAAGVYEGVWHDLSDKENKKPERVFAKEKVGEILKACAVNDKAAVSETVKPASESPPMLFDLTSLQREANGRFGFSARATLATAQSLYERHKLITYPRTDSRALPEDYVKTACAVLAALGKHAAWGEYARKALDNKWVNGANKRIFNNAKISDHFAIIPTDAAPKDSLRDNERKLYDFIARRFTAAFYPPAKFLVTERKTKIGEHCFVSKGRVMRDAGWRAVAAAASKDTEIVPVAAGEMVTLQSIEAQEKATTPPPRYNEATLLSAMESAGKLVDDEDLREAMRERGLGTPATRAAVIEGLLRERYLLRDGRELLPTPKASSLMRLLLALKIDVLTKPALTGEWEHKLRRIEKESADHRLFMEEIRALTRSIVGAARECGDVENIAGDFAVLSAPCPKCGGEMREKHRRFVCAKCEFFLPKVLAAREFSLDEAEALLRDGRVDELEGFRSRLGREFSARVLLREDDKGILRPAFDFDAGAPPAELSADDLAQKEELGVCPKCAAKVRDVDSRYLCERAAGENPGCDFSMAKRILQQEISPEQMRLLLGKGKTAMLDKFISKKTKRPFKARLTMDLNDKEGKLGFEFAPRAAKKPAKKPAGGRARKPA